MRFLDLLKLLIRAASVVWPLPDMASSDSVRNWVRGALGLAAELTDMTATERDDQAVAVVLDLVNDDETWATIYGFIAGFFDDDEKVSQADLLAAVTPKADEVGIDPATIIAIITAIIELIKMWRDRKQA